MDSSFFNSLGRHADNLAGYLQHLGTMADAPIGLLMKRSPEMVIGILGILKSGGAWLPLDPNEPEVRLNRIIADAGIRIIVVQEPLRLKRFTGHQVDPLPDTAYSLTSPVPTPDNLAYVIFTSGSAGTPKGCMISHRAICNRLTWMQRVYRLNPEDRVLQKTPLTFDVSVWELFLPLLAGATLVLAEPGRHGDPDFLVHLMEAKRITVCHFVPSMLHFFLEAPTLPTHLRLVISSGEPLSLELMNRFRSRLSARLENLYGPTEAAIDVSSWSCRSREDQRVPIGHAIDNVRLTVLDANGQPVSGSEAGELYIGGLALARGYLNKPDLTALRFVPDPFQTGERLYATGDRVRLLDDGNLEYLGRLDHQVKVRGFRIEPGEIETVLQKHDFIAEAVVAVRGGGPDPMLVAWLRAESGAVLRLEEIRTWLEQQLPHYMIPHRFAILHAFPLTVHGKKDRQALPWPVADPPGNVPHPTSAGPTSPDRVQAMLRNFLCEVLHLSTLKPDADLFAVGATSLTMVRLNQLVQKNFNSSLPLEVILKEPTISAFARHICRPDKREPSIDCQRIDFFSREERERFKQQKRHLRWDIDPYPQVALTDVLPDEARILARASCYRYADRPVAFETFGRFLALLRPRTIQERMRHLFPSAGGLYPVQTYVQVKPGAVTGLDGLYYYHPERHRLVLLNKTEITRNHHFYYNRTIYDHAGFYLYFVVQTHAIEPVYGEQASDFAAIETGCIIQLLMTYQSEFDLGLVPIGGFDFESVRADFRLDEGHRFLLCMAGGNAPTSRSLPEVAEPIGAGGSDLAITGLARSLSRGPATGHALATSPRETSCHRATASKSAIVFERAGIAVPDDSGPGGYLDEVDLFDAAFFDIDDAEARRMDPQERLLLEVVWECLEDAGYTPETLKRQDARVGVFVGVMWHDHEQLAFEQWQQSGKVYATRSDMANRIAHLFETRGPGLVVDTSCSSALTAVHLARNALLNDECDVAIAGGVNLILHPYHQRQLHSLDLLSTDGMVRTFAATGTGWVPGEGAGAILLRHLDRAEQEGDVIHGILKGSAVINAGKTVRFGLPDVEAQKRSMEQALSAAGINAAQINYIESGAVGSCIADATEFSALKKVFGRWSDRDNPCQIGSLKPNIGHLESAAAMSQITRILLQFRYGTIAPTMETGPRNPMIQLEGTPFCIVHEPVPLPDAPAPVHALINASGASGSSASAVLARYVYDNNQHRSKTDPTSSYFPPRHLHS